MTPGRSLTAHNWVTLGVALVVATLLTILLVPAARQAFAAFGVSGPVERAAEPLIAIVLGMVVSRAARWVATP